jgi:hypothetical protein
MFFFIFFFASATLPRLRRLPGELRLPLVCYATVFGGRRRPLVTIVTPTTAARQLRHLQQRQLWWLLQRHHCHCFSQQRWLHLVAPLPRPLDRHRSDVAWMGGGSTSSSLSRRPCWSTLSPTAFLRSRLTRPLRRPWRIHLRRRGHRG